MPTTTETVRRKRDTISFQPTEDVRDLLEAESKKRRLVPTTFFICEAIRAHFGKPVTPKPEPKSFFVMPGTRRKLQPTQP